MKTKSNNLRFWIVLSFFSAFAFLSCIHGEDVKNDNEAEENLPATNKRHVLTSASDPAVFPLAVQDWDSCKVGKLMDRELRHISFTLKNITKAPVKILHTKSGCPCLKLDDPLVDYTLDAGKTFKVSLTIDGKRLTKGEISRIAYVEVEGYPLSVMPITGEVVNMWEFEPKQIIDLGEFYGDIPWKRSFKIKSKFEDPNVKLNQPAENNLFNLALTQTAPKEYLLEVTPKIPLPAQTIKYSVEFPVSGIENYGPVQVGIKGVRTEITFSLTPKRIIIPKKLLKDTEPFVVEAKIAKENPSENKRRSGRNRKASHGHSDEIHQQPVSVEEDAARPFNSIKTWETFVKDISITVPDTVKVEKIAKADGISIKIHIPKEYFDKGKTNMRVTALYKGKKIDVLTVILR